jgi:hypothetical protein
MGRRRNWLTIRACSTRIWDAGALRLGFVGTGRFRLVSHLVVETRLFSAGAIHLLPDESLVRASRLHSGLHNLASQMPRDGR